MKKFERVKEKGKQKEKHNEMDKSEEDDKDDHYLDHNSHCQHNIGMGKQTYKQRATKITTTKELKHNE